MSLLKQTSLSLTKDLLFQAIALNPTPIGRGSLTAFFDRDEFSEKRIDQYLLELIADGLILPDKGKGYLAVRPWADIGYADVGPVTYDRRTLVPLRLLNMPDDITATLSRNDLNRHDLKEGDRIIVGLWRNGHLPMGLRARFMSCVNDNQPYHLVGTFNENAKGFRPLDHSIKTRFRLAQAPVANDVPRQFLVEMRSDFDMRDPVIHVADDQSYAVSWIIAHKHKIAGPHSKKILREARWIAHQPLDIEDREDLRHKNFVTVDPPGARDLDDAVCAEKTDDGYTVYVAIADVPALVVSGSVVDQDAYKRGLTFYLADYTAHMLPPELSTHKCSLIPDEDRLAIVVKQNLGWDGKLKDFKVCAAVIRSREQLSYGQFYDLLDQNDPRFRTLAHIHDMQRRAGMHNRLSNFIRDSANQYASKSIIETLMVQTNSLIARYLKAAGVPFLSRNFKRHAPEDMRRLGLIARAYYAPDSTGHDELDEESYTHGTSPIRRYPDMVTIKAIHRALGNRKIGLRDEDISRLGEMAEHFNNCRVHEASVQHDAEKYHALRELDRLQTTAITAGIYQIGPDFVEVSVVKTGNRQRIPLSSLPTNQWAIDQDHHQLVLLGVDGQELRRYSRNDTILCTLSDVDLVKADWKISLTPSELNSRSYALVPA